MQTPMNPNTEEPNVSPEVKALTQALAMPFDYTEVKFKPAVVSGNRALALAYVDARVIQDRLDSVLGVEGWQDDYECLADGSVVCRLRLRLGTEWVTKVDVGGPSEQPDGGDRLKAAFSDALKRAAVKFGLGRYLYRLPSQWVDYDPQKRQFVHAPTLPDHALPPDEQRRPRVHNTNKGSAPTKAPPAPKVAPATKVHPAPKPSTHSLPSDGAELKRRLAEYEAKLVAQGVCASGELLKHIAEAGVKAGHGADLTAWSGPAFTLAAEETRLFEGQARRRTPKQKDVA